MNKQTTPHAHEATADAERWHRNLAIVLRRYGFWGLDVDGGRGSITSRLRVVNLVQEKTVEAEDAACAVFVDRADDIELSGLDTQPESAGEMLFAGRKRLFRSREITYRPLLDYVSFAGRSVAPIWQTSDGRVVLGWWEWKQTKILLVGLKVAEELVRYTQGNPARASFSGNRNLWGAGHEQPAFLYEGNVVAGYELVPWADRLGQTLAQLLAEMSRVPLFAPLPKGAKGAVMLTGDDDQASLEKYAEQLKLIGDFPITYLLLPHSNHTQETITDLSANVEFGIHVDALGEPHRYDEICSNQTRAVRELIGGRSARTVRNHGHLNRDYWGHLAVWEAAALNLDLNVRGIDGTCPTGSYLPFRVRRPDSSWSSHFSLFSTFSDSMLFLQKWPEEKQSRCIRALADQIEKFYPGIMVFNFHPQNVSSVRQIHHAVIEIGQRPGWLALGAESFLQWLEVVEGVRLAERASQMVLTSSRPVTDLALRWPETGPSSVLPTWEGEWTLRST
jgi:hypothetical protein